MLSSVELQVLTSSCFKLRTVHNIPVTSNKDGKKLSHTISSLFLSSYFWMLCMFLLLSPFFLQSQTHVVSHCSFLSSLLEFKFTQKRLLHSQHKKKPHNERGGPCRRESRLQYVSHLARSSQCHAVCRRWPALSSKLLYVCFSSRSPRCTVLRGWW